MKVGELIALLQDLPEDTVVVLSSDSEGNSYSPLSDDFSLGKYIPDSTYSGEFFANDHIEEDGDDHEYFEEASENKDVLDCIVLWPTN